MLTYHVLMKLQQLKAALQKEMQDESLSRRVLAMRQFGRVVPTSELLPVIKDIFVRVKSDDFVPKVYSVTQCNSRM